MIWKALSDPTRRSILNLLKTAPRTTGELSDQFEHLSRFAIMKHLGVLEKANLVKTKREGKFRWNYINTKPIQRTYDEWVANLTQLKYFTNSTSATMADMERPISATSIRVDTLIKASRPRVWKALTQEINQWWLPTFFMHSETKEFILEVKLGGLLYELTSEQEGIVWANVIGIDAPNLIQLKGHLTPAFGGPAISFLSFDLEESGKATVIHFKDELFGDISDKLPRQLESRWQQLLHKGLKQYIEG